MKLLITGSDRALGRAAVAHFGGAHDVVATSDDLRDPEKVAPLVSGVQGILHLSAYDPAPLAGPAVEQERLDTAARGAYVLLKAAREAGVDRAILASRLSLLDGYPDDYVIDESFRAVPEASAESLAPYLAELTFREFAREGGIRTVCLRFGALDAPGGTKTATAMRAFERALAMPFTDPGYRTRLFHVAEGNERYPLRAAKGEPFLLFGKEGA